MLMASRPKAWANIKSRPGRQCALPGVQGRCLHSLTAAFTAMQADLDPKLKLQPEAEAQHQHQLQGGRLERPRTRQQLETVDSILLGVLHKVTPVIDMQHGVLDRIRVCRGERPLGMPHMCGCQGELCKAGQQLVQCLTLSTCSSCLAYCWGSFMGLALSCTRDARALGCACCCYAEGRAAAEHCGQPFFAKAGSDVAVKLVSVCAVTGLKVCLAVQHSGLRTHSGHEISAGALGNVDPELRAVTPSMSVQVGPGCLYEF